MDCAPMSSARELMEDAARCFREAAIMAMRAESEQQMQAAAAAEAEEEEELGYEQEAMGENELEEEIELTFKPRDRQRPTRGRGSNDSWHLDDAEDEELGRGHGVMAKKQPRPPKGPPPARLLPQKRGWQPHESWGKEVPKDEEENPWEGHHQLRHRSNQRGQSSQRWVVHDSAQAHGER
eukprot:6223972-Alexandrium_andersonii.AAC.1